MGNKLSSGSQGENNKATREISSGKRLLLSIRMGSPEQTKEAIELGRKECIQPSGVFASTYSYDDMVKTIYEYLTKEYLVMPDHEGDPPRYYTPEKYAIAMDATDCASVIRNSIVEMKKAMEAKAMEQNNKVSKITATLKNRQREYDYTSKGLAPPPSSKKEEKPSIKEEMASNPNRALEAKMKLRAFQEQKKK